MRSFHLSDAMAVFTIECLNNMMCYITLYCADDIPLPYLKPLKEKYMLA